MVKNHDRPDGGPSPLDQAEAAQTVPAVTVDRQCGSSQQALHFAVQAVMSGTQDVVIAAGVESMTRVPMFADMTVLAEEGIGVGPVSPRIRARFGVDRFSQFAGAEMVAGRYGLTQEALDRYALQSHRRAAAAVSSGAFDAEIVPLQSGLAVHARDEGVRFDASPEAIAQVESLTDKGLLTVANSSQICDAAAGGLIVSERALRQYRLTPLARIVDMTVTAGDPVIMLEEPIYATRRALKKSGLSLKDIDIFELNEAFASIPLAWLQGLGADPEKTNVNGGAIALGIRSAPAACD